MRTQDRKQCRRVPVPYVLARRTAETARFAALLEPFQAEAAIAAFSEPEPGGFVIESAAFVDRIAIGPDGAAYSRTPP